MAQDTVTLPIRPTSATPADQIRATLAHIRVWIEESDRRLIAMDARWLTMGEDDPIFDGMTNCAARSILRTPAIVWG